MNVYHGLPTAEMGNVDVYIVDHDTPQQGLTVAFVSGDIQELADRKDGVPVRLESSCRFGELATSMDCDCGAQLAASRALIAGGGVSFTLDQEGRGAGLEPKLEAMRLQQLHQIDTFDAYASIGLPFDQRDYSHVASFLVQKGLSRINASTNNPRKITGLESGGITVVNRSPLIVGVTETNIDYLRTKATKGGHLIPYDLKLSA
jgi:GTP cyclohydrolase II